MTYANLYAIFYVFFSSVGVPGNLPIFGESGGISRLYQLAEWFGPCDLIAERDFIARSVLSPFIYPPHARARLFHTRNIRNTRYNPNTNSGDIFILMHIVRASESDGSVFPCMISLILGELMPKRAAAFF